MWFWRVGQIKQTYFFRMFVLTTQYTVRKPKQAMNRPSIVISPNNLAVVSANIQHHPPDVALMMPPDKFSLQLLSHYRHQSFGWRSRLYGTEKSQLQYALSNPWHRIQNNNTVMVLWHKFRLLYSHSNWEHLKFTNCYKSRLHVIARR